MIKQPPPTEGGRTSQRGEPVAGTGPAPRYGPACLCGVLSKSPLSSRPLSSLSPPRSGALSSLPPHWQVRPGVGHHRGKGLMDWVSRTGLTEQETSLWGRPLREERDTRTNTRDGEPNGRRRAPFLSRAWPRSRSGSREPKGALCRVVPGGARRQLTKGRRRMPDDAVYPRFLFGAGPFLPLLLLEVTPSSPQTPPSSAPFLSPLGGARRSSGAQAGTAWTSTECSSGLLATQV